MENFPAKTGWLEYCEFIQYRQGFQAPAYGLVSPGLSDVLVVN
jgi:hypothetical protein